MFWWFFLGVLLGLLGVLLHLSLGFAGGVFGFGGFGHAWFYDA